uniref:Uncharacterized protein n=1 Tax=Eutreptiella gymnastica TaxID=73025 RepID=A0A7S4GD28_9EUGL
MVMHVLQYVPVCYMALHVALEAKGGGAALKMGGSSVVLATLLHLMSVCPFGFWVHYVFHSVSPECVVGVFCFADLVLVLDVMALGLWFVGVRAEFLRNKEQELFNFYQYCQESCDIQQQ